MKEQRSSAFDVDEVLATASEDVVSHHRLHVMTLAWFIERQDALAGAHAAIAEAHAACGDFESAHRELETAIAAMKRVRWARERHALGSFLLDRASRVRGRVPDRRARGCVPLRRPGHVAVRRVRVRRRSRPSSRSSTRSGVGDCADSDGPGDAGLRSWPSRPERGGR